MQQHVSEDESRMIVFFRQTRDATDVGYHVFTNLEAAKTVDWDGNEPEWTTVPDPDGNTYITATHRGYKYDIFMINTHSEPVLMS